MSKYMVDTYSYGRHYVWAKSPCAAKSRIVFRVFGRGYDGYEHDYWSVTKVEAK